MGFFKKMQLEQEEAEDAMPCDVPPEEVADHMQELEALLMRLKGANMPRDAREMLDLAHHHLGFIRFHPTCLGCGELIRHDDYEPSSVLCGYCRHMTSKDD